MARDKCWDTLERFFALVRFPELRSPNIFEAKPNELISSNSPFQVFLDILGFSR
ncbi:MAG: hypothetical protein AAFQ23_06015 [Cyanobacteria bacterium J06623_1]